MRRGAVIALWTLSSAWSLGQGPPPAPPEDPFARYLFPPDQIFAHGQEIGLDDSQKTAIRGEVLKAQPKFVETQLDLQGEVEKMTRLLQGKPVDETKVLAEVDRILGLEKEIKKAQISLLVRIKNVLNAGQQSKLAGLLRTPPGP